ncbi:MAG: FAD-binding protein [Pseudomonadota bacterium]
MLGRAPDYRTDVLVVGAGGAGMYAALAAAGAGAQVTVIDKNLVGRGGATIMAQMTVASALGEAQPDSWEAHLADTLQAGRGLCNEALATLVCRDGPERIREMGRWGTKWAKRGKRIAQVTAPGHDRPRCCYVDFLNTGPAVAGTLRKRVARDKSIRRVSNFAAVEVLVRDNRVFGLLGLSLDDGKLHTIQANAVVIATGGLTKLYARNSASNNMAGEGYALGALAGATLVDMEFVQFFPIGHLAPRLVGMDPIMWDPFRYKLGGRLLNGDHEEFIHRYGGQDEGTYSATRDLATYAIYQEVAAGRGTPNGGAYLSFEHIGEAGLRDAFGPVIDRLAANGIDLLKRPIEVAPIAHYHMGGLDVGVDMQTGVQGLFAAGEAVGGASGANRLSGNAITEALVFGEIAGREAASMAPTGWYSESDGAAPSAAATPTRADLPAALFELQTLMWKNVGAFRSDSGLQTALGAIRDLRDSLGRAPSPSGPYPLDVADWHELRLGTLAAEAVTLAAIHRKESRGAHQRDDFPATEPTYRRNLRLAWATDQFDLVA